MNSIIRKTLQSFALIALAAGICLPASAQDTSAARPAHHEAKAKSGKSGKGSARANRKAPVTGKISINNASAQELTKLPRIGDKVAQRIVEYRAKHGGFKKVEELMNVKGIGEKTFEHLRENLSL